MLGDIQEQFARGKSRLWFWQEVTVAIVTSNRSPVMKRAMLCAAVLGAVFFLGYWTARSPLVVREKMPSATELAELQERWQLLQLGRETRSNAMVSGSIRFLQQQKLKAEVDYRKTGTATSKARLDQLRQRVDEAEAFAAKREKRSFAN
jgi:hypothetical protein